MTSVDTALSPQFEAGDAISIDLAFDTATPNLIPGDPHRAAYAWTGFTMQFGSYFISFPYDPTSFSGLDVLDNFSVNSDGFGPTSFTSGTGAPVNGLALWTGFFGLLDFTQTAFNGIALPTSLDLTAFQSRSAELQFCTNLLNGSCASADQRNVIADITSFSNTTNGIPEPGSLLLCLIGLGYLALAAARNGAPLRTPPRV